MSSDYMCKHLARFFQLLGASKYDVPYRISTQWFCNYLSGRSFSVSFNAQTWQNIDMDSRLPQGSTLGQLMYIIYASELQVVVERHGGVFHSFADDTQLSKATRVEDIQAAKQAIVNCIKSIQDWSSSHRLKLNAAKSEVIWLGTRQQLAKLNEADRTLQIDNAVLKPSTVIRNLGVLIDEQLSMDTNARQCAKTCFFHLRRIRQLHRYVDCETLYMLVRALVLSRLDYCNSLFASSFKSRIKRLQRVQDAAARLLCNAPPRAHASSLRKQLHWLPVSNRIQYKLCTIMFDVQHDRAPEYIMDLCVPCQDSRLRSAARGNFEVRGTKLKLTAGDFSVAGPHHYNTLPTLLRQAGLRVTFCSKLKTDFFSLSYNVV